VAEEKWISLPPCIMVVDTWTNDVAGTDEKWSWSRMYAATSRTVASPDRTPARNVAEPKGP